MKNNAPFISHHMKIILRIQNIKTFLKNIYFSSFSSTQFHISQVLIVSKNLELIINDQYNLQF